MLQTWFAREILPFEAALTQYLAKHRPRGHDVEDLRNDIYIRVLEAARVSRPQAPRAFLFVTARNLLVDRIRHDRVVAIDQLGDLEISHVLVDQVSAERHTSGRQQLQRLAALFDRLPRRCREVLWMRRIEGLPQKVVAQRLGLSDATVERHLYRAVRTLTEALRGVRTPQAGADEEHTSETGHHDGN